MWQYRKQPTVGAGSESSDGPMKITITGEPRQDKEPPKETDQQRKTAKVRQTLTAVSAITMLLRLAGE